MRICKCSPTTDSKRWLIKSWISIIFYAFLSKGYTQTGPIGLHVSDSQRVIFGSESLLNSLTFQWIPEKMAMRIGFSSWDLDSIGLGSKVWGGYNDGSEIVYGSLARGLNSTAWGENNIVRGKNATSWGLLNNSRGENATTWGVGNIASVYSATAWGSYNEANGNFSVVWGEDNIAEGESSSVIGGVANKAEGSNSMAWGSVNISESSNSTTWGSGNNSLTSLTTTWGQGNVSSGPGSTTWGVSNCSPSYYETTFGHWATQYIPANPNLIHIEDRLFTVGNGTQDGDRSNALTLFKGGELSINTDRRRGRVTIRASDDAEFGPNIFMYGNSSDQVESGRIRFVEGTASSNWRGAYIHYNGSTNALYIGAHNTNSNSTLDDVNQIIVKRSGGVGIQRSPTSYEFEVNGQASKAESGEWEANSDERLKKNIKHLDSKEMLAKLLQMEGVEFEWDDQKTGYKRPAGKRMGFTAQNLQKVWPEKVSEDEQGFLMAAYGSYDPIMVEAIRALNEKIDSHHKLTIQLQQQIKSLLEINQELQAQIDAMSSIKKFRKDEE